MLPAAAAARSTEALHGPDAGRALQGTKPRRVRRTAGGGAPYHTTVEGWSMDLAGTNSYGYISYTVYTAAGPDVSSMPSGRRFKDRYDTVYAYLQAWYGEYYCNLYKESEAVTPLIDAKANSNSITILSASTTIDCWGVDDNSCFAELQPGMAQCTANAGKGTTYADFRDQCRYAYGQDTGTATTKYKSGRCAVDDAASTFKIVVHCNGQTYEMKAYTQYHGSEVDLFKPVKSPP